MDYTIKWSPEATEDLESITDYIVRDSEFYARSVVAKILAMSQKIAEQPMIERIVPEIGEKKGNCQIKSELLHIDGVITA